MKRMWIATTFLVCAVAQSLIGWNAAYADDNATGAQLLPKDTLVFFSVPDIPEAVEQFNKSLTGAMLRDPEFKPFLDGVHAKISELSDKLQDEVGVSLKELLAIPSGELTFAVVERPVQKLAIVLMIDCGKNKESVDKLLKKMHAALDGDIAEHSASDYHDVKINTYTFKNEDSDNPFKTLSYFNDESYLVFSSEVDAIKEVVDRWDGESDDVLAKNDIYQYVQDRCNDESGEPDAVWFISPIGIIQAGLNMATTINPQAGFVGAFLPMFGVDKLKGIGGASFGGSGDFDEVHKMFLYADQPSGLLNVFLFPATELAPPKWVSAETSTYFAGNWGAAQAYQAIEGLVDSFYGRGSTAKQLDKFANSDGGAGIHPKKDFLDLLDGKFHMLQNFESDDDNPISQKMLMALEVKDAAKMKKTLAKVAKSEGSPVETREFNGETIYELNSPSANLSMLVTAGSLIITNDTTRLEGILRSGSQTALADTPDYRKIAKHFPAKVSMISFQRPDAQMKTLYEMLKNAEDIDFLEGIDVKKLPPFEAIQKYLRPSGSYTVPEKKGALSVGFQLREGDR